MPVPTSFDDLSEPPSSNSPAGSETVGPQANDYLQAAFAFIRQLRDGLLKPIASVDFNAQKITNIAAGTISTTSKDAVRGDQLYKVGQVEMWHGAVANIATVWGPGWQLADGTNGTADLRDKFIVGAGATYAPNGTGGSNSINLTVGQLPAHAHTLNQTPHSHGITDGTHNHGLNQSPHNHDSGGNGNFLWGNSPLGTVAGGISAGPGSGAYANIGASGNTGAANANISLNAAFS